MNEQLEKILINRYPEIFVDDIYLECGTGWFWILDALCANIRNEYERQVDRLDDPKKTLICPSVSQVKEKFGSLRFYLNPTHTDDDVWLGKIDAFISMAESMSSHTCENCGNPAVLPVLVITGIPKR